MKDEIKYLENLANIDINLLREDVDFTKLLAQKEVAEVALKVIDSLKTKHKF